MTQETILTAEQDNAIEFVLKHIYAFPVVALAGPAGSGKTTVLKTLVDRIKGPVTVCATTNKAAVVLRRKGLDAITLHQACMTPLFKPPLDDIAEFLCNTPIEKSVATDLTAPEDPLAEVPADTPKVVLTQDEIKYPDLLLAEYSEDKLYAALSATKRTGVCSGMRTLGIRDVFAYVSGWLPLPSKDGVLIIDEASMIGERDIATVMQVFEKVILVGDEYQLPPVKDTPVFWNVPQRIALTQIHRQAEGSQPLEIATKIRTGGQVIMNPRMPINYELAKEGMPVLVWKNATRIKLTMQIRKRLGYEGLPPQVGEFLICRNGQDREAKMRGLYNNSLWKVTAADGYVCTLENESGEKLEEEHVYIEELDKGDGVPFRFAYALTAHNAQGSEWPNVMVHAPDASAYLGFKPEEGRKFVYTAVTRGKEKVTWVA